jgi:hypothetical protein
MVLVVSAGPVVRVAEAFDLRYQPPDRRFALGQISRIASDLECLGAGVAGFVQPRRPKPLKPITFFIATNPHSSRCFADQRR